MKVNFDAAMKSLYVDEIKRLQGNSTSWPVGRIGTRITGQVDGEDPKLVLQRIEQVLCLAVQHVFRGDVCADDLQPSLPSWFLAKCATESGWDLEAWLMWFEPENRTWFWWSGFADDRAVVVEVVSDALPFAWAALEWLMHSAGCSHIESQDGSGGDWMS